ncbi:MAG: YabP/YqfC family sporulation protein [Clostridia bacterium]|nr:YabP/YqfC family sporulation protein [Clostridia bacterium]
MQNNVLDNDKLSLESRNKLTMTGVQGVDGFTEQCLKLTVAGNKVIVNGENIKITAYNKNSGNLSADGVFNEIKYSSKKAPLIKRIFK